MELFGSWLDDAVAAGCGEPHAATLSTVDEVGRPSGRVLILKSVDAGGWRFASSGSGRKGRELAANPWGALTFYWSALGRQVRVRGAVQAESAAGSARDFRGRSPGARAVALLGKQSEPLADLRELDPAIDSARERVDAEPDLVAPGWTLYALRADEVEFWQGDTGRRHVRLSYRWTDERWSRELLWP